MKTLLGIHIVLVFLWAGFVCAISFLESWIKFKAPGMTLAVGVGVGRLVFQALNRVEIVFALVIIGTFFFPSGFEILRGNKLILISIIILILQTFWMLPILDRRASMLMQNQSVLPSKIHIFYVLTEVVKVSCLLYHGIKILKKVLL